MKALFLLAKPNMDLSYLDLSDANSDALAVVIKDLKAAIGIILVYSLLVLSRAIYANSR